METKNEKPGTFSDLDRILKVAEDYDREYKQMGVRHGWLWSAFGFCALMLSFPLIQVVVYHMPLITTILTLVFIVPATVFAVLIGRSFKRIGQQKRIIREIVEVVRGVSPVIAQAENWSKLQEFEIRLRLALVGSVDETLTDLFASGNLKTPTEG